MNNEQVITVSGDSEQIAKYLENFKYDPSNTKEVLEKYNQLSKQYIQDTPKTLIHRLDK